MGSMVGDTACVDIALESDNRVEGDESFFLELESTSQFLVVDPNTQRATITITDETSTYFKYSATCCHLAVCSASTHASDTATCCCALWLCARLVCVHQM